MNLNSIDSNASFWFIWFFAGIILSGLIAMFFHFKLKLKLAAAHADLRIKQAELDFLVAKQTETKLTTDSIENQMTLQFESLATKKGSKNGVGLGEFSI